MGYKMGVTIIKIKETPLIMHTIPYAHFAIANEKLWKGMPFRERQIIKMILVHDPENPMKVSDLISIPTLGSPATVHSALKNLIESGYLKHFTTSNSSRGKFITLTKKSTTLIKKLNETLVECASIH
jgi:DNA-binding MarR family transcriptional regulator